MNTPKKRLCVFCGSSPGADPAYAEAAVSLGQALVSRNYGLVYGGGNNGLMGTIASAVLAAGGHVTGIIPDALVERELAKTDIQDIRVVSSMHERKAMMESLSDGFIAMPGGIGTQEEIFEALTWAQLGIHAKPCGLLNVASYYDGLIEFLDHATTEQFLKSGHRSILITEDQPETLLDRFEAYQPPAVRSWQSNG